MAQKPNVAPCRECGKELAWNVAPWPVETTPRALELCEGRAYVFRAKAHGGGYRAIDVRGLAYPPDDVYPQHICPVWRAEQAKAAAGKKRAEAVLQRMTRE